jgi:ferredoxin--NADP+ reductase
VLNKSRNSPFLGRSCFFLQLFSAAPGQLEIDYAISREMTNPMDGGKLYVQHVLQQQADKLLERLEKGAVIYFCGLKGMMPGILEALEDTCASRGLDFSTKLKGWQANHQWHVEVY